MFEHDPLALITRPRLSPLACPRHSRAQGYLCFCIVYKWMHDWVGLAERPPSLISMLIAFFMSPGDIPPDAVLYEGQAAVQLILFLLAFLSVPWMLLSKPLLLRRRHLSTSEYKTLRPEIDGSSRRLMDDDADATSDVSDRNGKYHQDEFDFSEVMMHQVIHTIEYVLGCISNTASYLRLWALSLAHKQLSAVFYEMILVGQVCGWALGNFELCLRSAPASILCL